jgi:hypothetical protein
MSNDEFLSEIRRLYPTAKVGATQSGACTWVGVDGIGHSFTVQITPDDGVGVSEVNPSLSIDFSGHEEVFEDLDLALGYIKSNFK